MFVVPGAFRYLNILSIEEELFKKLEVSVIASFSSVGETVRMLQANTDGLQRTESMSYHNSVCSTVNVSPHWRLPWKYNRQQTVSSGSIIWTPENRWQSTGHYPTSQSHQWGNQCRTGWLQGWRQPCGRSWLCCPEAGSPPWWSRTPSSWPWSLVPPGGDKKKMNLSRVANTNNYHCRLFLSCLV